MQILKDYINGQWVTGTGELLDVFNPSTGEVIAKVPVTTTEPVSYTHLDVYKRQAQ